MSRGALFLAALIAAIAGRACAVVAVTVQDGAADLGSVTPVAGSERVLWSTTDGLRFSNEGATERELLLFTSLHVLTYDGDGSASGGPVQFQGQTVDLSTLLFAAQSSAGVFLPLRVTTQADMTGQAGWTKHASCGAVTLQGSFSIPSYTNAGVPQAALTRYYQACDAGLELYLDSDKDLSSGADFAHVSSDPQVLTTAEADHEVVVSSTDYAFFGTSGSSVILQQGRYLAPPVPSATSVSLFLLHRFPDGFPAGVTTSTLTATATDITL